MAAKPRAARGAAADKGADANKDNVADADAEPDCRAWGEGRSSHLRARDECTRTAVAVWDDCRRRNIRNSSRDKSLDNNSVASAASS